MPPRNPSWENRIGRRLTLRDLHILSVVVECGSMAKGAKTLGMSQPAVSEAVTNLEGALKVRLLDRSQRGIEPTIYARALLERGHVVFDELQQGVRHIEFLADPTVGEIRLGCPESMMAGLVPAIIDRMSRQCPRVVVHVANAQPGEQEFRALSERRLDIMMGRILRPISNPDVQTEMLCNDELRVVAGSSSPWARRRKVSLMDLESEPWVMFPTDSVISSYLAPAFRAAGCEPPRGTITSFSMHLRMQLLATGRYLTIMHGWTLRHYAVHWPLKPLPIELKLPPAPIAAFTLKNRTISPVVTTFLKHARDISRSLGK